MQNPFHNLTTVAAIKKAYRKLSLTCHPDVRPDKEQATIEFRELTRIYNLALSGVGERPQQKQATQEDWWHRDPSPPPKPKNPIVEEINIGEIDNFEFDIWGEAIRTIICSRALLLYGGKLRIWLKAPGKSRGQMWEAEIPSNCPNPVKIRMSLPVGPLILTLVGRR